MESVWIYADINPVNSLYLFTYVYIYLFIYYQCQQLLSLRAGVIISLDITRCFLLLCQCSHLWEQEYSNGILMEGMFYNMRKKWTVIFITEERKSS